MAVPVARMGEGEVCAVFGWGNVMETDNLEDVGIDGRIILKWSLKELDVKTWTVLSWLRRGKNWRVHVIPVIKFCFPRN